ncbi:MAG: HAMP domain-containing protein [Acidobacteria bacterium]|nr:HAMP domain-containing protein [Acidobacteriota bacterium]
MAAPLLMDEEGNELKLLLQGLLAVKRGNFAVRLPDTWTGINGKLADTFNEVVEMNQMMAAELERVGRVVGKEGKITQRARFKLIGGSWSGMLDSMNGLIDDLVRPTSEMTRVIGAVAKGDLSQTMTVEFDGRTLQGEFLRTSKIVNAMVEQLGSFSAEVTRVAREVGTEGKLGGQAQVKGLSGTWKDLTDSVNSMANNLTAQVRNIADVTIAVANGDLSKKITVDVRGEILQLKDTMNTLVDQLRSFSSEVTRVAREVGTDGKLGGQAVVPGVAGVWKDLTDNVNFMASNLTSQVRNIAQVATAIASGDLSKKITVDVKGEILELKNTINTMVDQLNSFAAEVTRVAREVGTEGKLGGQAEVKGVAGTWKDLTDNVNFMASNLTSQVRNIAQVSTAIAKGDLSKKITVEVKGEILELKNTINTMVDQLNSFAGEVSRVAREVGTDGKLGGQAQVPGVSGTWKDLTDNVNSLAANLTGQVRNIAQVATAIASGDLSKKITVDVRGEILELKNTINTMVDQLNSFAAEVTRVAREVGTEGKLGGQAQVPGVSGTWKDLTDNVNFMAANLTGQVRNIAEVTTAVANGDLSKKITVDVKGEILELKNTINTMVDQLNSFAGEVSRVAREVGTEGKLGGQAEVKGVAGTWKDLTDNVNFMASNLTSQVRNIAQVATAIANGDLSKKITVDVKGEILQLKDTINTMVDQLNSFAGEVSRVAREVGTEGKLGGQAIVKGVGGTWKDLTDNGNFMASNLTSQVRNIAQVATAIASGDLSKKITVDVKGEILELKNTINTMVDQLNSFAAEVTRVAREVGTEGKLGGQAEVPGVSGTWKDLTDNVNSMAANLTDQVRGIAKVVTAVADGDLKQKLTVQAKGEIASLAETINNMIDTLATFADQVTGVAREVGVDGRLGGQAVVPGAAGTWRDLTDNVNQLAANLTTQVRAIAEVATAVTKGDLSRTVQVVARGEVEELKNNINEMIRNLKETTQTNAEQDWLKTNIAKFTRLLQGQRDLLEVSKLTLSELAPLVGAQHGIFYIIENDEEGEAVLKMKSSYGYRERRVISNSLHLGESLVGQAALEKQRILLTNVPADYVQINSGLGEAKPLNVIILPVLFEGYPKAVIELASFERFSATHQSFLEQLTESLGIVINTIQASTRTEDLLKQSQSLAKELQSQQEILKKTNEELEDKARLLEEQKIEVEQKNQEVELAKSALEEKAEQLALTSKYKSEFLSNMSHELRTPLNSLLILAQQLAENPQGNLEEKQREYARTIQNAGQDLLALINDILDLSKIESGTVTLDLRDLSFSEIEDQMERVFRHQFERKGLRYIIERDTYLPKTMFTDSKRLQQILKNLLANALKFTERGQVRLRVEPVTGGWNPDNRSLNDAPEVLAFAVSDTGIGIPAAKQKIIFESFQQAESGTSRKYGGTGLGLTISRELAQLLGGELVVQSEVDQGSTFTLFIPLRYKATDAAQYVSRRNANETEGKELRAQFLALSEQLHQHGATASEFSDDREEIQTGDAVLLIIEDDMSFARIILSAAQEQDFKGIIANSGEMALTLAAQYQPTAITLDINLPDMNGWVLLDQLKVNLHTRHIPVQVMSVTMPSNQHLGHSYGVLEQQEKPTNREGIEEVIAHIKEFVEKPSKHLLVVAEDNTARQHTLELLGNGDIEVTTAGSVEEGLAALEATDADCLLLDANLPDKAALRVLEGLVKQPSLRNIPVVLQGEAEWTAREKAEFYHLAKQLKVKEVASPQQLFAETALFLHRAATDVPEGKRHLLFDLYHPNQVLVGKKVMIVDDDIRNIFALTSLLEAYGMQVYSKDNGKGAIELLKETPDLDVVLMDMMMPEYDGYETMMEIRSLLQYKTLPIIALTAKAMKGDRQKCLDAGASDYIAKPVNREQLLSALRVWTCQEKGDLYSVA